MKKWLAACSVVLLTAGPLPAQSNRIGVIDFYGLRRLAPAQLVGALSMQIGDAVGKNDVLRTRLLTVPGVADAQVTAVCCEAGRSIIYVGVRETGTPELPFRASPTGALRLPGDIVVTGENFLHALQQGVQSGNNAEDDSAGYSVVLYPPARAQQQKLIAYAQDHVELLRAVMRNASDSTQRALATQMMAYTPDRAAAVQELLAATEDPSPEVRNNALRALAIMALYKQAHPDAPYDVPVGSFVRLLNSIDWTDRNKASFVLVALTESRDPALLKQLRDSAFDALTEMARWKVFGHAVAPALILGRMAGIPDQQVVDKYMKDREKLIQAARAAGMASH